MSPAPPVIWSALRAVVKVVLVTSVPLVLRGGWWFVNMVFIQPPFDPLRHLPGPNGPRFLSLLDAILDPECSSKTHEEWRKLYGKTLRFPGFGRVSRTQSRLLLKSQYFLRQHDYRLFSVDFRVITHVLTSPVYEKPWQTRVTLEQLIGRGIFSMEGAEHRFQRKLLAPAFSTQSIRNMLPIFLQKSQQLCDQWQHMLSTNNQSTPSPDLNKTSPIINILPWVCRASFDVIGLAGFDHPFNSLNDETEEFYLAYNRLFDSVYKRSLLRTLAELYFPIVRTHWPDERSRTVNTSMKVISTYGKKIIERKRASILNEGLSSETKEKDLLSLLIKGNLSSDPANRMSDDDLLDQCSTFLLAGADTVALGTVWALHYLSHNPKMQERLRDELLTELPPSADQAFVSDKLDGLPYLDAVVRETLRFTPPIHSTIRTATSDDHIPISHPMTLQDGTTLNAGEAFKIRKGSNVHIPIEALNLSPEIWGENAMTFEPERWLDGKPTLDISHPGLGNMMTFIFGPHSCLGYMFAIYQIKAFLATIVPRFSFAPAPGVVISKFSAVATRPYVEGKWVDGMQLPIIVQEYRSDEGVAESLI